MPEGDHSKIKCIVMKKLMTMITAAALLLSTSSFAADPNEQVSEKTLSAFAKGFPGATNISWTEKEDYSLAEFKIGSRRYTAAYDEDGQLIASSKSLTLDELPIMIKQTVNENYPGYETGINVMAITSGEKTDYILTVSNTRVVLHIKVSEKGNINIERKVDL